MRVLLATDGSRQSDAAIEMLKRFQLGDGDALKVVSVIDMAVPMSVDIYGGYLPDTAELERTARENTHRVLEESEAVLREHFGDRPVDISSEALFGSPESRITESAEEFRPDLIVLGSHGYKTWERLLLGSVSESVLHHVKCSVLIARAPDEES